MSGAQLPLRLGFPRDQRLDDYLNPPSGLLATLAALAEGTADGVLLIGGPGSGRSHLLLATCAQASERGRSVAYLPLGALAADASSMLAGHGGGQLVCVDDVQAVAGDRGSEIALFDLYNRVRACGGALLFAADAPPARLPLTLPDLRSRLAQCAHFSLSAPDDALRRQIVRARANARGLEVDDAVLDYLFRHTARDLASLTTLLDRLDRESLVAQRRITLPFLKGVLEGG